MSGKTRPKLVWTKSSYKRYAAEGYLGIEIVLIGLPGNKRWVPEGFGGRGFYKDGFEDWQDAAIAAERSAVNHARKVLAALQENET